MMKLFESVVSIVNERAVMSGTQLGFFIPPVKAKENVPAEHPEEQKLLTVIVRMGSVENEAVQL